VLGQDMLRAPRRATVDGDQVMVLLGKVMLSLPGGQVGITSKLAVRVSKAKQAGVEVVS